MKISIFVDSKLMNKHLRFNGWWKNPSLILHKVKDAGEKEIEFAPT